jgi:hypothetical protein
LFAELFAPGDERWRQMLEATRHDVYHLPGYGSLYEPEAREVAVYVRGSQGELLLPLMIRPLPAPVAPVLDGWSDASSPYGYPGPLIRGHFPTEELVPFRESFLALLRQERIATCFVRASPVMPMGDPLLEPLGTAVVHGEAAIIELELSAEQIWSGFDLQHRRQIRRLHATGYSTVIDDWRLMDAFVEMYRDTMRRVGASAFYLFEGPYFGRLKELLGERLHLVIVLDAKGVPASGCLATSSSGIVTTHLIGSASSQARIGVQKLIYDAVFRWGQSQGCRAVNLGGGVGGKDTSLFLFKKGFSTTTKPFKTFRIVLDQALHDKACAAAGAAPDMTGFFPAYRQSISASA